MSENLTGYFPGSDIRNNVVSYMESHLLSFPDRVALRWSTGTLPSMNTPTPISHQEMTYRAFAQKIASFAQGLLDIGITKGDRVIIFLPMSVEMYTAMFAVQRIGAIAVFLDSWARSHHLGASAECVTPKAMISVGQAFHLIKQVPEFKSMAIRIMLETGKLSADPAPSRNPNNDLAPGTHLFKDLFRPTSASIAAVESETTALITFTTGSTGKPKGANRTHQFLSAQHQALSRIIPYTPTDIDMPAFPIFSLNNLASGVTTVLPAIDLSAPSDQDAAILASQIIYGHINCATLSPSMLAGLSRFIDKNNLKLPGLTRVVTGGAPISKDDVKHFYQIAPQADLWILYGSTEAEPMAHIEGREMLATETSQDPEIIEEGVNVGHISEDLAYKFVKVVNGPIKLEDLSIRSASPWASVEVQTGQVGEFICTGDHVCRDYYNNPSAFLGAKILGEDGRVWHRTGDLAYLDKNKNLWIVGRTNNAIQRKGEYFFPVRAEVLLKRLPFTGRCAFLGLASESDQTTAAVIELQGEIAKQNKITLDFDFKTATLEIQRLFRKNKIPLDSVYFVAEVPMDPRHHSKVEYANLRNQLQTGQNIVYQESF
jgi:acyl-CoA synthetase (AMP-forming)/AMP-acid ligase II